MGSVVRIPLDDGDTVLLEILGDGVVDGADGPVKAGRLGDLVDELPVGLRALLQPVTVASRTILEQLRQVQPDELEVEFGVNLAGRAGAVITSTEASCHLKVRLQWNKSRQPPTTD
ncbi:CU044_2847 family protein [Streptomyces sp. NPDC127033]|uniref:CU044_2847 family protein n=1 Tax=Streptomyces sp. NPDC127033 TaxID=3347110 RepID=UPI0036639C07